MKVKELIKELNALTDEQKEREVFVYEDTDGLNQNQEVAEVVDIETTVVINIRT